TNIPLCVTIGLHKEGFFYGTESDTFLCHGHRMHSVHYVWNLYESGIPVGSGGTGIVLLDIDIRNPCDLFEKRNQRSGGSELFICGDRGSSWTSRRYCSLCSGDMDRIILNNVFF